MREKFDKWIQVNKKSISKSEKYSKTITTISNHFKKSLERNIDLYKIIKSEEILKLKEEYFSYTEFLSKNKRGNRMYSRSLDLYIEFLEDEGILLEIEKIENDPNLRELEKEAIILSRIGQGKYRNDLIKIWKGCSLSGYKDVRFLIASHIKPWKVSNNDEKVDKFNGLLLLPTYDKLFDLGFITFDKSGFIKISKELEDIEKIGINEKMKIKLKEGNLKYLEFHYNNIFKKTVI
ncbi:HNH endonuclease [Flavobacterium piscisymbiosum]|uniref:HNH endonuclease n=1 Tax=Flavobacterium piscisymbiosum TaxID=2893753 RepID=A0ABS8MHM0_9FLAO|nr:HNH endonuclease signature motif containing protein [Flavobacterium sp. F-30]MCC9064456.1 HNH endonuclease [Flavobacterium sp. F-30]